MQTHHGEHRKNRVGSCRPILKKLPPGLVLTDLSHLSLLVLQGAQFMAFRVRFVGLLSSWCSRVGEPGLGRTRCFAGAVLVIAERDALRCFEG